jgi:hypothetical protein
MVLRGMLDGTEWVCPACEYHKKKQIDLEERERQFKHIHELYPFSLGEWRCTIFPTKKQEKARAAAKAARKAKRRNRQ